VADFRPSSSPPRWFQVAAELLKACLTSSRACNCGAPIAGLRPRFTRACSRIACVQPRFGDKLGVGRRYRVVISLRVIEPTERGDNVAEAAAGVRYVVCRSGRP
jgi:hypothetical protein